jgi:hypothetical protein
MHASRTIPLVKGLFAGAAIAAGLAICTGQLTAATLPTTKAESEGPGAVSINQTATVEEAFSVADRPDVFIRAGATRDALGFPVGSSRSGRHVHDAIQGTEYDEVAEVDSTGKQIALAQFATDGRLITAVRFDAPPAAGTGSITGDGATKAAQRALAGAGITVAGPAKAEANAVTGGWDVHWARNQGAYAVRGDETRVHVWQDGRVESVAHVEHKLAAAPTSPIAKTDAGNTVSRQCDTWFTRSGSGCSLQGIDLEWVGPNSAFDAGNVVADSAPYRLAWVANVKPTGPAAGSVRLVTLYVDAATGAVIGGDVVE